MTKLWLRRLSAAILLAAALEMAAAGYHYSRVHVAAQEIKRTETRFEELLPIVYEESATPEEAAEFELIERDYEAIIVRAKGVRDAHKPFINILGVSSFLTALIGLSLLGRVMAPDEPV